jgi:diguanylate cyclase
VKRSARHVVAVHGEIAEARAELSVLQARIDEAHHTLDQQGSTDLVSVNEHLVCSAMHALREAEECRNALEDAAVAGQFDVLTQLPNRSQLMERLSNAIAEAKRQDDGLALLFIDLDNFKHVNDDHGHATGDALLKIVAQRLADTVRKQDTASRHGGDEFLVLLTSIRHPTEAVAIARKLVAAISAECVVEPAGSFVLGASIGISVFPQDGSDAGQLIARADLAMYQAKRSGAGIGIAGRSEAVRTPREVAPPDSAAADNGPQALQLRLQEANEQLLLAALSSQELARAAEAAHRQQRDHFAVVAHELRSPLSPIRMAAALLNRLPAQELPRMQAIIEREVVHMTRIIGDLLDLSRVHTGKLRLDRRVAGVEKIVEEAIDACRPAMVARQQNFTSVLSGQPLMAYADPMRLAQVFRNLLDNASKYTADGGDIAVEVAVVGHTAEITVSDNGIGITPEALPLVFEPFAQDAHAIGFNGFGLGIGLTVVRELIEGHGGTVLASSDGTGKGSRFVVTLPLSGGDNAL